MYQNSNLLPLFQPQYIVATVRVMGWENSDAGFPIEDEKANSGNSVSQEFEKGVINKKGNEIEFVANRTRIRSRPRSDVFTPR